MYAIRLQYRLGAKGGFSDLLNEASRPVEYLRNSLAGHSVVLGPNALPSSALNQPYVQLRWKYYWLSGTNGPRDELRLDDIFVMSGPIPAPTVSVLSFAQENRIKLNSVGTPWLTYSIDTSTNLVDWQPLSSVAAGMDGTFVFEVNRILSNSSQFYRLRWP
jgi:hypothetical protein